MSDIEDRKYANAVMKNISRKKNKITSIKSDAGISIPVPANPTQAHIAEAKGILGSPKKVNKRGGGMTRQGLYPAEESRSGTMSEDERRRYMTMGKKGGGIVYRNMGRAIGGDMGGVSTVSYFYDD